MTSTEIMMEKHRIEEKRARSMKRLKTTCIFELVAVALLVMMNMSTTTSEKPGRDGIIIFFVLALIIAGWNSIVYYAYKNGYNNELAKIDAMQRRLEEEQKILQMKQEEQARKRAVQDAVISLAESAEKELQKHPTNCPNCGALLESHVCSYCGTHV